MKNLVPGLSVPVALLAISSVLLMIPMNDENHPFSIVCASAALISATALAVLGFPAKYACAAVMLTLYVYLSVRCYERFRREFIFNSKKARNLRVRCEARIFYSSLCLLTGGFFLTFSGDIPNGCLTVPAAVLASILTVRALSGRNLFIPVRVKKSDASLVAEMHMRDHSLRKLFDRTVAYMEEKKPYANSALPETELAKIMGVSTRDMSRAISLFSKDNYSVFVKKYRVEYATNLMIRDPFLKVTEVGRLSGFQSEGAFTDSFKDIVGTTPSAFMRHERYRQKRA